MSRTGNRFGMIAFVNYLLRAKHRLLTPVVRFLLLGLLGTAAPITYGQSLTLIWSDEFNSATSSNVDTTKWVFDLGNTNGWGNNELEYYTDRTNNAFVADGVLHIHAQIESTNGFRYTSARLKTQGLFNALYGRMEWRAKLPAGVGMWPALWMLGSNIFVHPWPDCGEIDVVENNGAYPYYVQGSIHSGSDASNYYLFDFVGATTNFHVYDLDWTPNSINWSVDGNLYETQTSWTSYTGIPYPFPFNQPFFLLMNLAVGGDYLGDPGSGSIDPSLPNEIQVDYVRVYKLGSAINPFILSVTPSNGCPTGGTPITVNGINFQSGATITIFGVNATGVTFVNSNTLTAVTGGNTPGTYNVVVKVPGKSPTTLTNGFSYVSPAVFSGPGSAMPEIGGATLSWSAASGALPLTYSVYESTNSGGEAGPLLTTNALSVFIPLSPGSNSPTTYFFKVRSTDGCGASDANQVELSVQPLLDPDVSQVGDGIPNSWKLQYGFSPFDSGVAAADSDGDGLSNLQEFLDGTNPLDNSSPFHVMGIILQGSDALVTWSTTGGMTNAVESTPGPGGTWSNISGNIVITGSGVTTTNYLDPGAATNAPANYYHIRLVP